MAFSDFSTTASSNTTVGGVSVAEGMAPSGVNDALRAILAELAGYYSSDGQKFTGNVYINRSTPYVGEKFGVNQSGAGEVAAFAQSYTAASKANLVLYHAYATGGNSAVQVDLRNAAGATVGSITSTTTATGFNTSSDYRLKNVTGPLTGSGAFIDALKPKVGTWNSDGSPFVGFIAHEVQAVSPTSVVGVKDGPEMQAVAYASPEIIANLVAEVQSLRQRVAALEAR